MELGGKESAPKLKGPQLHVMEDGESRTPCNDVVINSKGRDFRIGSCVCLVCISTFATSDNPGDMNWVCQPLARSGSSPLYRSKVRDMRDIGSIDVHIRWLQIAMEQMPFVCELHRFGDRFCQRSGPACPQGLFAAQVSEAATPDPSIEKREASQAENHVPGSEIPVKSERPLSRFQLGSLRDVPPSGPDTPHFCVHPFDAAILATSSMAV